MHSTEEYLSPLTVAMAAHTGKESGLNPFPISGGELVWGVEVPKRLNLLHLAGGS